MEMSVPGADEIDALDTVLGPALHFPGGTMREFMETLGLEHMRAIKEGGRIVAGLGAFPTGQWYGGALVPAAAVTAVGVAPDVRGTGVGSFMLRESLLELRNGGIPLAALYPATLRYYHRAGYARAGNRIGYELPLTLIGPSRSEAELVPFGEEQYSTVRELYRVRARQTSGNLDRTEWLWKFRLEPKDRKMFRYLIRRNDQFEGYLAYFHGTRSDPITITDLVVLTPDAGRRVLAMLAGYHTMVEHATWAGGALDPLLYLLGENLAAGSRPRASIKYSYDWMLRIVDVAKALAQRGYPQQLRATLELEIDDDVLSQNSGRYTLEIADGKASVTSGGRGLIKLGIRELAAIYTGFMAPVELRTLGTIEGSDADLALMGALFAGPRPWIADMF